MKNFTGTGVALITPFTEQGNIDVEGLRHLVSYVIEGGVDFWWHWEQQQKHRL